ncbi:MULTISPECIES: DNA adenine methylase [Sphingobium]|uniref:DNA adenine methylase n=1 Tax=Sphingobium TaxID=165695 RepID=UPI0015ECA19D|nr:MULTISPECIES: DNA adenine methylase [Sphingobium]MCW2361599.1 DNA adenine methylase [Sphingobium sp. B10D3B]MCW2401722.1 DNA adenine methylase [Sphingobium sp. B10D7B]MCW2408701.1 DNA adenine methylase [Sphingobium xanthum]
MESLNFCPSAKPIAPYIGGKRNLARRLVSVIDAVDCTTYAEPFIGMGGVFLRRRRKARAEVINDISEDVATLFRILQRHYVAFMDMLRFQLTTRAGFERLKKTDPSTLTDLERAARFLYLQRTAFAGKVTGRNFGVSTDRPARFDVTTLAADLEALHERLASVTIERLPYAEFIRRYDRPATLFYLDPPYYGSEDDYGAAVFSRDDFDRLAEQLACIAGKFILSINATPETREIFSRFTVLDVETTYTISTKAQAARELIVANFDISAS